MHLFETTDQVARRLTTHFVQQGLLEWYKILGSVEFLGEGRGGEGRRLEWYEVLGYVEFLGEGRGGKAGGDSSG